MHKVVKPFPYSEDGFTLIDLAVGDERDFGAMTDGLVGEGFIEPSESKPVASSAPELPPVELDVEVAAEYETKPAPRRGRPRK